MSISSHGAMRRNGVRFARFSVGEKDHQTLLLRLSNLLRKALAPCSPFITHGNFRHKTTWPAFQPSLPPGPYGWGAPQQSDSTIDDRPAPRAGVPCVFSRATGKDPTEELYCRTHGTPTRCDPRPRAHVSHPGRGAPALGGHHRHARPGPVSAGLSPRPAGLRSVAPATPGHPRPAGPHLYSSCARLGLEDVSAATGGPAAASCLPADPSGRFPRTLHLQSSPAVGAALLLGLDADIRRAGRNREDQTALPCAAPRD